MEYIEKGRIARIRSLIAMSAITAIILIISTYAWFVGMQSVYVSNFEIDVQVAEGLSLSLDGENWDSRLTFSVDDIERLGYAGSTNSKGGAGLIPVSTVGAMDTRASRMILFEKSSFATTPGGYRIMASRVKNYYDEEEILAPEQDGYVVFDLFIRNLSGTEYYVNNDPRNEEAIYLTTDSKVVVETSGGIPDTGIENSVRIAFAQIGRVKADTVPSIVAGITCNPDPATGEPTVVGAVTGICRKAQIWEPNDTEHNANAISYYKTSCRRRIAGGFGASSYSSAECSDIVGTVPTFAIHRELSFTDEVDLYDGYTDPEDSDNFIYNGFSNGVLEPFDYFTDSEKILKGVERPAFMTLAPNSITKVRVYIYIEGQDIDNYNFAQIGKRIAVNFGFTKERLTQDDIEYEGPDLAPVINLLGDNPLTVIAGEKYEEPGYRALDDFDGDITHLVEIDYGEFNPESPSLGNYTITYTVQDKSENVTLVTRQIYVVSN